MDLNLTKVIYSLSSPDSTKDEEAHQFDVLDFDSLLKQAQKGAQS